MEIPVLEAILSEIDQRIHYFEMFQTAVETRFRKDPPLNGKPPIVHSIKSRTKDRENLAEKIRRKHSEEDPITPDNVFDRITDIAGVRVLHLYQQDFSVVNDCVQDQIQRGEWIFHEDPKAYTWDPESQEFFEAFGLRVEVKPSFYTSIHYVVRPRSDSEVACEIQVRTLFEEIWGEIDHQINYPELTKKLASTEQLRVLARLVGAGSRLADAIYRVDRE